MRRMRALFVSISACFTLACPGPTGGDRAGGDAGSSDGTGGAQFQTADASPTSEVDTGPEPTKPDTAEVPDVAVAVDVPDDSAPDTVMSAEDTGPPEPGTPVIIADPAEYTFSYISPLPQPLTRQFNIVNQGNAALTVTAVSLAPGGSSDFSVVAVPPMPKVLNPGDHTLVIVLFQEKVGLGTATLQITSSDPKTPVLDVPLASYIKANVGSPDPCVQIMPSVLNFGSVQRGDTKTLPAILKNCSDQVPLVLSAITRSSFLFFPLSEELQITPMPALPTTIPPGQGIPVDVTYAPLLAGPDAGYFLFHTDDPAEPQVQLDVAGFGTQPPPEELALTIKLSWDTDQTDVDSHLIQPGGSFFDCKTDCHFGNPSPDWGTAGAWQDDPFLDLDDVDGFGPEHTNISEPQPGTYRFIVHYYDDTYEGSSSDSATATVEVFSFGNKIGEFGPQVLTGTNHTWDVFDVVWPGLALTPLNNDYTVPSSAVKTCFNFAFP